MGGVKKRTKVPGMWVSSGGFYVAKLWRDGQAKWVPLGTDYEEAKRQIHKYKAGDALPSKVTLKEAVEEWLAYVPTRRGNPKDVRLARARTERYLLKYFSGETRLGSIVYDNVSKYRAWLDKQSLAPRTVHHILSDFRALLKWAERTSRVDRSPFISSLLMPGVQESAPKGLSPDEEDAVVALAGPLGWTWRFLLGTGLRWGEACRARADHVRDGMLIVAKTKSKKVRRVPLPLALREELKSRVGLLIPYSQPGSFARISRKLTGLENLHVHQTRHTYAMRWVANGGSLAALQEVLGHSNLKTTQIYARVTDDMVRREAERIWEQIQVRG